MKMFVIFKEQEKSISFGNYTYNNTSQKKKGGGGRVLRNKLLKIQR